MCINQASKKPQKIQHIGSVLSFGKYCRLTYLQNIYLLALLSCILIPEVHFSSDKLLKWEWLFSFYLSFFQDFHIPWEHSFNFFLSFNKHLYKLWWLFFHLMTCTLHDPYVSKYQQFV